MEGDSEAIAAVVTRGKVTHINFVPSMLKVFLDSLAEDKKGLPASLEYVLVAGEAFPASLARQAARFGTAIRFENIYGPTEATIYTTGCSLDLSKGIAKVPIGKPLNNIRNYIVDESLHLQPVNVGGELCIAGVCLARGYLNRPELTAEKFPGVGAGLAPALDLSATDGQPQGLPLQLSNCQRLYRTGDLTRWLPDGNIEYLGRIDHQVKIRGFRIELEEIEKRLLEHENVKETVVTAGQVKGGDAYLCAYIVAKDAEQRVVSSELRHYLSQTLPVYMIPAFFIPIEQIPLNPNGKIDRKCLPEPGDGTLRPAAGYMPPENRVEETIVRIWQEILSLPRIGIHDNFFDIGGNSLNVIRVGRKLKRELGITVPVVDMFRYTTVSKLAAHLGRTGSQEAAIQEGVDREDKIDEGKKRRLQKINRRRSTLDG